MRLVSSTPSNIAAQQTVKEESRLRYCDATVAQVFVRGMNRLCLICK